MKIALGSASELHYQLLLARDLDYLQAAQAEEMMQRLRRSAPCCTRSANVSNLPSSLAGGC